VLGLPVGIAADRHAEPRPDGLEALDEVRLRFGRVEVPRADVADELLGDGLEHPLHLRGDAGQDVDVLEDAPRRQPDPVDERAGTPGSRRLGGDVDVEVRVLVGHRLEGPFDVRPREVVLDGRPVERRRHAVHRHVVGRPVETTRDDDGVEGVAVAVDGPGDDALLAGHRQSVTAVSHYRIDRPTAGGRTGKQSQQSLSIRATATPRSVSCRASHVPLVFPVSPARSSSPTVGIAACMSLGRGGQ